ncbi:unnamed protein product [Closterium sp. NIES-65]|nr:unnamed protein product [Closterium sp. NIES-65]
MTQPINLIFRFLQSGFDEYMNLVLEDAEEISMKKQTRKPLVLLRKYKRDRKLIVLVLFPPSSLSGFPYCHSSLHAVSPLLLLPFPPVFSYPVRLPASPPFFSSTLPVRSALPRFSSPLLPPFLLPSSSPRFFPGRILLRGDNITLMMNT